MARHNRIDIENLIQDPTFVQWVNGEFNVHTQEWEFRSQHNPEDREVMDQARLVVEGIPFNQRYISESKVKHAWEKMEATLERVPVKVTQSLPNYRLSWSIAAAVLLVFVSSVWIYNYYQNREENYVTDYGERQEINLPDGSMAILNANSSIRFLRRNPRNVIMTGEVYFDIKKKHETGEPFIVHTPDLDIHVLGTEFNVNSRHERTDVLLETGRIELDMNLLGRMEMEPGDFISYSSTQNKILDQQVAIKPEVITSWKEGFLLLDSISLESTLGLLEDTYDITTVVLNKELGGKILVGGIPNDNLAMCVKALRTIYNLEIELTTDSLIVR